jgi:hypothetical protein
MDADLNPLIERSKAHSYLTGSSLAAEGGICKTFKKSMK